jgi:hypothetical protein
MGGVSLYREEGFGGVEEGEEGSGGEGRTTEPGVLAHGAICLVGHPRKVDVRLPGEVNSHSHGARPAHLIITIRWRMRVEEG